MSKETILYPGLYDFICRCGGQYTLLQIKKKKVIQNHCFYCSGYGKHVKLMENQLLEFATNWNNKLNCKAFTTLRLRNDKKYYKGARLDVRLKGVHKGTVKVQAVNYFTLDKINDFISFLDTGYPADECKAMIKVMYKNRPAINWATQSLVFVLLTYEEKKEMNDLFE